LEAVIATDLKLAVNILLDLATLAMISKPLPLSVWA